MRMDDAYSLQWVATRRQPRHQQRHNDATTRDKMNIESSSFPRKKYYSNVPDAFCWF